MLDSRKIEVPIGSKNSKELIEFCVVISKDGYIKYVSSDHIHAARFAANWGGVLYRVKENHVDKAKDKALATWRAGHKGKIL